MGVISEAIPSVRLEDLATWEPEEVKALSLKSRFHAIGLLLTRIRERSPAPDDDPLAPICEKKFGFHIEALIKLVKSIEFSEEFDFAQTKVVKQTLDRLSNEAAIISCIAEWEGASQNRREAALRDIEELRRSSAQDVFGFAIRSPDLRFTSVGKSKKGRVLLGGFTASLTDHRFFKFITINTHPDSTFHDGIRTARTLYHEGGGHDNQFALAHNLEFCGGMAKLGRLLDDAEIGRLRYVFGATIPPRIKDPYDGQCHEIDANKQEQIFEEGLLQILSFRNHGQTPSGLAAKCG